MIGRFSGKNLKLSLTNKPPLPSLSLPYPTLPSSPLPSSLYPTLLDSPLLSSTPKNDLLTDKDFGIKKTRFGKFNHV